MASKQQKLISHRSRGRKSKIEAQADWVFGEGSFLVHRQSPCWFLTWRKREGALWSLLWGYPHDLITSKRPYLQTPSHWGVVSTLNLGGHKHSVCSEIRILATLDFHCLFCSCNKNINSTSNPFQLFLKFNLQCHNFLRQTSGRLSQGSCAL